MLLDKILSVSIDMTDFFVALNFMFLPFRKGAPGPVRKSMLKDCISVHKLLETILDDHDAASSESCSFLHAFILLLILIVMLISLLI